MFRLCAVREVVVDAQIFCVNFKEEKGNRDLRLSSLKPELIQEETNWN